MPSGAAKRVGANAQMRTDESNGGDKQMFGVDKQVPHAGAAYIKNGDGSAA